MAHGTAAPVWRLTALDRFKTLLVVGMVLSTRSTAWSLAALAGAIDIVERHQHPAHIV